MEMNTRLQVEHPVTEMVTGQDLVEWQLRIASGEPLPLRQDEIELSGHAMEARLYAESPAAGFLPSTGPLRRFRLPAKVRVDTGVEEGGEVTPFYDPMIAKLIAWAPDRTAAARALSQACRQVEVWPVKTNAAFLARVLDHPDFVAGGVDTSFLEQRLDALVPVEAIPPHVLQTAAHLRLARPGRNAGDPVDPWRVLQGFQIGPARAVEIALQAGDETVWVTLEDPPAEASAVRIAGEIVVFADGQAFGFGEPRVAGALESAEAGGGVRAPMPGKVVSILVAPGDVVAKGQPLLVVEAMKMEHALVAAFEGVVREILVRQDDQVTEGQTLARLDQPD
jgi:acetyl/propionyl-CoA carboxylase alpha subunit